MDERRRTQRWVSHLQIEKIVDFERTFEKNLIFEN